ncbi:hypothetical protein PO909_013009 [Leuciscus waleckii]
MDAPELGRAPGELNRMPRLMVRMSQRDGLGMLARLPNTVQAGSMGPRTYPGWSSEVEHSDSTREALRQPEVGSESAVQHYLVPGWGRGGLTPLATNRLRGSPRVTLVAHRDKLLVTSACFCTVENRWAQSPTASPKKATS